jgi:cytochrome b561
MFVMPLTGYLYSAAGGYPLGYFWTFNWPRLFAAEKHLSRLGEILHASAAWGVYAVVGFHIMATFWHAALRKDETFARMWPPRRAAAPAHQRASMPL